MTSDDNWDAYSHQELYDRIHGKGGFFGQDGAGTSGATGQQDGWPELAAVMARARERTEAALRKAGAAWEGAAADSMQSGVAPLAQWAADANTAGTASQSSVGAHVDSYSGSKNQMPEPVPVTSTANTDAGGIPAAFTHLFGGQTDQDKQEAAAQEAKAEAVRTMYQYQSETGIAQITVGEFVPPPSVTVDVPPPEPKGGDIPVGGSEAPGPGHPGGDGTRSAGDTGGGTGTGSGTRAPNITPPPGTTPSATLPAPPAPAPMPTDPAQRPDQFRPGAPLAPIGGPGPIGRPTDGAPGGRGAGSGGPGRGPGSGGGVAGRGPGGAGPGTGGPRGGIPGVGALANEPVAGRPGSPGTPGAPGARGAGGMGMGPMGGGRAQGDEDAEHTSPEYLRATHDSFWDATDPVAPPVIGEDDD